uniref:Uncharacterized protein n=1 Tax=Acrobeloides nanus TaxID=290746 RepID=A0A914EAG8_9BILA
MTNSSGIFPNPLDFTEAIKDSPSFSEHGRYFSKVHKRYDETLKNIDLVIEHGQNFVASFYNLTASTNSLWSDMEIDDPLAASTYKTLSDALAQIIHLNKYLIEYSFPGIKMRMSSFVKNELVKVNETKSHFENLASSFSDALSKKASINKNKVQELNDAKNSLTAVGTLFAHTSLDYVAQLNIAHARKCHSILEALAIFIKEYAVFYRKGYTFFYDQAAEIDVNIVMESVENLKDRSKVVDRKMQDRHSVVPKEVFQHPIGLPADSDVVMEGYLFKRATNAFKTWNRRWFQIKEDKLLYLHCSSDAEKPTVMEDNLKLCLVRPAPSSIERPCCFELVTPTKSHLLQADSEALCNAWIRALQRTIQHLHEDQQSRRTSRPSFLSVTELSSTTNGLSNNGTLLGSNTMPASCTTPLKNESFLNDSTSARNDYHANLQNAMKGNKKFYEELRRIPGNDRCADCGCNDAKWASLNLGVIICIECSGVHRSLGVHVSKVRSLTMDAIDSEQRNILLQLGNRKVNGIYLAYLPDVNPVPPPAKENSSRQVREIWIQVKYVEKRFALPEGNRILPHLASLKAISHNRSSSAHNICSLALKHSNSDTRLSNEVQEYEKKNGAGKAIATSDLDPSTSSVTYLSASNDSKRLSRTSFGSDAHLDYTKENSYNSIVCEKAELEALQKGELENVLRLMVVGVDMNAMVQSTFPLHIAVENHRTTLVEFLLLNGTKINVLNEQLNTPLHVAAANGLTIVLYQLLKRNADRSLKNRNGQTPLDLAIEEQHAEAVTLLRLHDMREEFSYDYDTNVDETVDSFIDDLAAKKALEEKENDMASNFLDS